MTTFNEFRKKNLGMQIECGACGEVFATLTEETRPKTFNVCPCDASYHDWGDGYYRRYGGQARRKEEDTGA